MSSLAGALDQPASYTHGFSAELLPPNALAGGFSDQDVDMNPPSTDVLPKEEEETAAILGVLDDGAHEEEMEDLFGNEADEKHDIADTKSDR
jgi:RNA polymerase-associated protein LEO1